MADMDLNYYLHREQVERVRADAAAAEEARAAHAGLADLYRQRIEAYRIANQANAAPPRLG